MPPLAALAQRDIKDGAPPALKTYTTVTAMSLTLRIVIILLGAITLVFLGLWLVVRLRERLRRGQYTEFMILESEISIDFGDDVELDYEDGRASFETIVSPVTPGRMAFEIDKLPTLQIHRKSGNILERRGKKTLVLQPSENLDSDVDMAFVDINDGHLTVSPFSSKKINSGVVLDLPARRRTPRFFSDNAAARMPALNTAPHTLQSSWRPAEMSSPVSPDRGRARNRDLMQ